MEERSGLLNIVDDYNREVLHIETDTSLPTIRLIRALEYLKEVRQDGKIELNTDKHFSVSGEQR
jgi:hypothetical protein